MELKYYFSLKDGIIKNGFYMDLKYIQYRLINPCNDPDTFAKEYIWVVINSGMRFQIASKIYNSVITEIYNGTPIKYVFNHEKKVNSIEKVYANRDELFFEYEKSLDKLDYLVKLPWIGEITKFHLARNLGIDVCKPDRHLVRISQKYNSDPFQLCNNLSKESKDPVGVVDFVLWSSGNLGFI